MASVYRRRGKDGKREKVYTFKFKDYRGHWRTGKGWPDKQKTLKHAQSVEAEHRAIRNGEKEVPPSWLRNRNRPIQDVVSEYLEWGRVQGGRGGRPWDDQHAAQKRRALKWWVKELGLTVLADIDLSRVEGGARKLLETICAKTVDGKVEALRSLCVWGVKHGLLASNPLAGLGKLNTSAKVPHRALTAREVAALLAKAPQDRRLWYETALETGYHVSELRALKVGNLDPFMPSLTLEADHTKDRKEARQPITRELAEKLSALCEGRPGDAPLLDIPRRKAWLPFNADCEKAGIRQITDAGRASWHSLRKVYVNAVVRSGADLKTIMALARHSTASLSMEVYASAEPERLRDAAQAAARQLGEAVSEAAWCARGAQAAQGGGEGIITQGPEGPCDLAREWATQDSNPPRRYVSPATHLRQIDVKSSNSKGLRAPRGVNSRHLRDTPKTPPTPPIVPDMFRFPCPIPTWPGS